MANNRKEEKNLLLVGDRVKLLNLTSRKTGELDCVTLQIGRGRWSLPSQASYQHEERSRRKGGGKSEKWKWKGSGRRGQRTAGRRQSSRGHFRRAALNSGQTFLMMGNLVLLLTKSSPILEHLVTSDLGEAIAIKKVRPELNLHAHILLTSCPFLFSFRLSLFTFDCCLSLLFRISS